MKFKRIDETVPNELKMAMCFACFGSVKDSGAGVRVFERNSPLDPGFDICANCIYILHELVQR